MQAQSNFVEQKGSISSWKVVFVFYWQKGDVENMNCKHWINPNNQKRLLGVKCFSGFTFSLLEIASQAPLDGCNSINWSQRLVSMPCDEAAYKYLDGWRLLIFCGFAKGITVLLVLGVSWGLQDFFFFLVFPIFRTTHPLQRTKGIRIVQIAGALLFLLISSLSVSDSAGGEREKWMFISGSKLCKWKSIFSNAGL